MTKFGGKTNTRGLIHNARKRAPRVITEVDNPVDKRGRALVPVLPTGRTSVKGDRSGLKVPQPPVISIAAIRDGSAHTVLPNHSRDPETGRIFGARIGPCRACGHTRMVGNVTGLCGVRSCIQRRVRQFNKRRGQRLAS